MRNILQYIFLSFVFCSAAFAQTAPAAVTPVNRPEAILGVGDIVKITVYQNPDLTVDGARISEVGQINFPLIGSVQIGGLTANAAEKKIASMLKDGGFVLKPQVTIQVGQIRSSQISILGQVGKPGRYPIETVGAKVSEMVAAAGGVLSTGADIVTLVGTRDGKSLKVDIDMPTILQAGRSDLDFAVENGDIIYVDRAPVAYMYGEVQKPGQFRLERGMTLIQALAANGGLTPKGTQRGMKVQRKNASGAVTILDISPTDPVLRDDVIYVKESLF